MEEASNQYLAANDPQVMEAVKKLEGMYMAMSCGPPKSAAPPKLTLEKMLKVLDIMFEVHARLLTDTVAGLRAQGKNMADKATMVEMNAAFSEGLETAMNKELKPLGMTHEMIQPALAQFQTSPAVVNKLNKGSAMQQEKLLELGLA
ncbi:unnamed protein product [Discosporangium mesarthrocarpum]